MTVWCFGVILVLWRERSVASSLVRATVTIVIASAHFSLTTIGTRSDFYLTTTIQLSKQDITNCVLEGLKETDEKGLPDHYVISHSYTEHEEIISNRLSSIEEVVDEFISILNSFNQTDDDEFLTIDGFWEDTDVLDTLHIYEFKEVN